jgi:DNA polymerase elongation subunit (family B)
VEFETLKLPHLQTSKKKTYAAHEYPPGPEGWKAPYVELYKGFAFKKRDRCPFVYAIGKALMRHLLSNILTEVEICRWLQQSIAERYVARPTESQLGEFIITCRLGTEYKQENVLALHLAGQYEKETGTRPRPGSRLRYVIVSSPDQHRKHFQSSMTPEAFVRDTRSLDTDYYLGTQLLLPLKQILDLRPSLYSQFQRVIQQQIAEKTRIGRGRLALLSSIEHQDGYQYQ